MKVLITGASGFLGRCCVRRFLGAGHHVRALVRRTSDTGFLRRMHVEIVVGDLKDSDSLARAASGVDCVVHAAATMTGTPQESEAATGEGTRRILAAAEAAGVRRFVHVSSIVVLRMKNPPGGRTIDDDAPYEDDPRLLSTYTRSKLAAEQAAVAHARSGRMAVIILRPGLLYGPGGKLFLPRMGYPVGSKAFVLIGMGGTPLPVCYVENCAAAILSAAENEDLRNEAFNVLDDEPIRQIDYLREIRHGVLPDLKIIRFPFTLAYLGAALGEWAGRILKLPWPFRVAQMIQCRRRLRYSNEKARRLLGLQCVPRKEALDATTRYFAEKQAVSRRADIRFVGRLSASVAARAPLKTCLIGCGGIAQVHAGILRKMPNARLAGVSDMDRAAAEKMSAALGGPAAYTDVERMLEEQKPDVVHVLTPPQSHAPLTRLAAQRGCHVLVEKPMAANAAEAREMADCAARYGIKLCVDHNHLYDPVMVRARKVIEQGALGRILWVESYYGFDMGGNPSCRYLLPGGEKHWTFSIPGGMFQNLAPHPLCLALECLGAPRRVSAFASDGRVLPHATKDELRIVLETPHAGGAVTVSLAASPRLQYLQVFGTQMNLYVDLLNKWLYTQGGLKGIPKPVARAMMNLNQGATILTGTLGGMAKVFTRRWTPYDGMEILIREFYRAIQVNDAPPVAIEDALRSMEVMDETWRQIGSLTPPSA